jgi:CHAD domain-containing protein
MTRQRSRSNDRWLTAELWLEHLMRQVRDVRAGRDSEAVHQIRVAVARLRVWLALGGWRALDDDLRWLRDEAAVVRDIEVQLEQHPPARWAARLRERHSRALPRLKRALGSERFAATIEALRAMPPVRREIAYRRAARVARRALARGEDLRDAPSDISALHALRCALRRLRYALEWLAEALSSLPRSYERCAESSSNGDHRLRGFGGVPPSTRNGRLSDEFPATIGTSGGLKQRRFGPWLTGDAEADRK